MKPVSMGEDLDTLSHTEDIEEGGPDTIDTLESKNRELSPSIVSLL